MPTIKQFSTKKIGWEKDVVKAAGIAGRNFIFPFGTPKFAVSKNPIDQLMDQKNIKSFDGNIQSIENIN